jgi:hypothetical protein
MTSGNDIQHVISAGKRCFWLVKNDGAIINEASGWGIIMPMNKHARWSKNFPPIPA